MDKLVEVWASNGYCIILEPFRFSFSAMFEDRIEREVQNPEVLNYVRTQNSREYK